ncbi:MAG: HAD family phosphatase [Chloroflexi bacterium]|nr:HAD family phosphatase [Chloroflexota bacterium]MBU1750179.1 HAD family phosphatase [Chloroflexota bacterium]
MPAPYDTPIRAIIFDLGGVLERDYRDEILGRFEARWGLEPGHLQSITTEKDLWDDWATGRIDGATFWRRVLTRRQVTVPDLTDLIAAVNQATEMDSAVWAIAHALYPHYKLALLTNNTHEWLAAAQTRRSWADLFTVIVNSAEVGLRKPDPRIYQYTCQRLGVTPPECVFVDDRERNTLAAQALGMRTIVFQSASQLGQALSDLLPSPYFTSEQSS